jgi:hypothetical protein
MGEKPAVRSVPRERRLDGRNIPHGPLSAIPCHGVESGHQDGRGKDEEDGMPKGYWIGRVDVIKP